MNPLNIIVLAGAAGILLYLSRKQTPPRRFDADTLTRFNAVQYYIILNSIHYDDVPGWVMYRIGFIESGFRTNVTGAAGEVGMFQITAPLLNDYNRINSDIMELDQMFDPFFAAKVACWAIHWHRQYFQGNLEKAVRAYNTGRGGIESNAADRYWNLFQDAGEYFPEGFI